MAQKSESVVRRHRRWARARLADGRRSVWRKPASRSRSSRPGARIAPTTSASTGVPSTCRTATSRAKSLRRTRPRQTDCYACTEHNADWFVNDLEEPYTTPADKPFSWQGRLRLVGGRTNVWARQSYRLSEQDLKGRSFDGEGEDWPLDLRRPRALLRPGRGLRRHQRTGRRRAGAARRPVPAADADDVRRDAPPGAREADARADDHHRPHRQPHPAAQRPQRLPLLRARASGAASRGRTSTRRSRPCPTRWRPAAARSSPTRWSTR